MYNNWTRLDVREAVQTRLRDTTAKFWSTTRLDQYVRDGYKDYCIKTGACWHRDNFPLVASQPVYNLPDRMLTIDRMTYDYRRLDPVNAASFVHRDRVMETEEGLPIMYAMDGESGDETLSEFSPYQKRLRIIRVPSESFTNVYLEWISVGDDLTTDSSVLWNMADHDIVAVVFYTMWKAFSFEGPGQHLKFAAHFKDRYEERVTRALIRKSRFRSIRTHRMGEGRRVGGIRLARLPWAYGKVVR